IRVLISIIIFLIIHILIYVRYLKDIIDYTRDLLKDNYSARMIKKAKGRWSEIIKDLNTLAERLEENSARAKKSEELLNIILDEMKIGFILTKPNGEIVMANKFVKENWGEVIAQPGKLIQELIVNRAFIDFVSKKLETSTPESIELNLPDSGKYFIVTRYSLPVQQLFLYLFSDITDAKNLERIKSDFITNLSHELRTPLTAIKGYLDTLQEPDLEEKDREKFIKIVRENIERLINIVSDLLILSDVERRERKLDKETFDLNEVGNEVVKLFRKSATEKGLQLIFNPVQLPLYTGDRFLIQQVLINLISNAIKFTEKGKVELEIKYAQDKFFIIVSDTGIGISNDEIPRIFERFYTVDKTRSRRQGGTGLGLSIVKHIVYLHQGEIKVESRLQEGSRFTIILPVVPF
ncbi:MAG: ATP-binding protein, partial [candidate division WOR-3 bacterium]